MRIPHTVWSPTTRLGRFDSSRETRPTGISGEEVRSSSLNSSASDCTMADIGTWSGESMDGPGRRRRRGLRVHRSTPTEAEIDRGQNHGPGKVFIQRHRQRGPVLRGASRGVPALPRLQLRTGRSTLRASGRDLRIPATSTRRNIVRLFNPPGRSRLGVIARHRALNESVDETTARP